MTALVIDEVSHRFGATVALNAVSLTVAKGEILCLVGPSGCGKSTLLRVAAGLETLQMGRVSIEGEIVAEAGKPALPPEARNVGFLFQDFALFPHLSVLDNAAFGLHRLASGERRARAGGAGARRHGGSRGRIPTHALGRAAAARRVGARHGAGAPLFFLDEPFSGIDARLRRRLLEDTWRVLKDSGAASVVVTHDPEEAMLLGDRVAVMRAGRILQIGTPDAIYRRPESPFVAEFLGEVNKFRGIVNGAGVVETPLGRLPAPGFASGAPVVVIIRQQGVSVSLSETAPGGVAETASVPVTIVWVRPMGAASLMLLRRRDAGAGDPPIYARVSGRLRLAEGTLAYAGIDRDEVFVFPAETPTSTASGRG